MEIECVKLVSPVQNVEDNLINRVCKWDGSFDCVSGLAINQKPLRSDCIEIEEWFVN